MRRTAILASLLLLPGCTGFGTFLNHTFTLPGTNPNIPMADSENVRRALGQTPNIAPLQPEAGNVWPGPQPPEPTLQDIQQHPGTEDQRGFPPTSVPGATPGLPDHTQPRPRGSSTPPGNVTPRLSTPRNVPPPPPPPRPNLPGPGSNIVNTPQGPAVNSGGNGNYQQLTTPHGPGAIMVPNGNGTSTIINPDGTVQTVPTPR